MRTTLSSKDMSRLAHIPVPKKNLGLLASLLYPHAETALIEKIVGLSEHDWDCLLFQAEQGYVVPVLYDRLASHRARIPDQALSRLREHYLLNAARNLRLYSELYKVLTSLEHANVKVIVLKGAHLAATVYRDISLRFMSDIDLLVRKEDLPRVHIELTELGYERQDTGIDHRFHHRYADKTGSVWVEIHWSIHPEGADFIGIDVQGLWSRAHPTRISGKNVLVLCPEDLILYICLHDAAHHHFEIGMRTFCDLVEYIKRFNHQIDWAKILERSNHWNIAKSTYITLYFARELMEAAVPAEFLDALKPKEFNPEVLFWVKQAVLGNVSAEYSIVSENFAQLWANKNFRNRLSVIMKIAFPSREALERVYPNSGKSVAYLHRLMYLWIRYARSLRKMLSGDQEVRFLTEIENSKVFLREWLSSP